MDQDRSGQSHRNYHRETGELPAGCIVHGELDQGTDQFCLLMNSPIYRTYERVLTCITSMLNPKPRDAKSDSKSEFLIYIKTLIFKSTTVEYCHSKSCLCIAGIQHKNTQFMCRKKVTEVRLIEISTQSQHSISQHRIACWLERAS